MRPRDAGLWLSLRLGAYAPLDTTNPDVRRYLIDTYIAPALQRGYDAIALDNVSLVNNDGRCGVWRDGQWTQLYSGESRDPRHTEDKLAYIGWLLRPAGGERLARRARLDRRELSPHEESARSFLAVIGLKESGRWLERPFADTVWGRRQATRKAVGLVSRACRKGFTVVNYSCGPLAESVSPAELDWIVASFLVAEKPQGSFLAVIGLKESGQWLKRPFAEPRLGPPAGDAQTSGNLVSRAFRKGLAVVNISSSEPAMFYPPSGDWFTNRGEAAGTRSTCRRGPATVLSLGHVRTA